MSILGCIRVWMSIFLTFLVFIFIQYYIILVFDILKSYISELFIKTSNVKFSFKVQIRSFAHELIDN